MERHKITATFQMRTTSSDSTLPIQEMRPERVALEATDSWENHQSQLKKTQSETTYTDQGGLRLLKKKIKDESNNHEGTVNDSDEDVSDELHFNSGGSYLYQSLKERKKREKALNEMYRNPGIQDTTMHGMMVCFFSLLLSIQEKHHTPFSHSIG